MALAACLAVGSLNAQTYELVSVSSKSAEPEMDPTVLKDKAISAWISWKRWILSIFKNSSPLLCTSCKGVMNLDKPAFPEAGINKAVRPDTVPTCAKSLPSAHGQCHELLEMHASADVVI